MKKWGDIIKNMTLLSQFSLSFITPLLLCLLICWWMSTSLGIGEWIFIPGFFFGQILTQFSVDSNFYCAHYLKTDFHFIAYRQFFHTSKRNYMLTNSCYFVVIQSLNID